MSMSSLLFAALLSSIHFGGTPAGETPLPPPAPAPEPQKGCERYTGTAAGNDADITIHLSICGESTVTGRLMWISKRSGVNVRAVSGTRGKTGDLALKDDKMEMSRPKPGWRFCLIDRYTLAKTGDDTLGGTYFSQACNDTATLSLTRKK